MDVRKVAIMTVFAALPHPSYAQNRGRVDATESQLQRCLDAPANASTAGQVGCEVAARDAYDKRMNAAYAALLRSLPSAAAGKLREAQRAWLRFRDAHNQASDAFFSTRQGTMYVPMQAADQMEIVRHRATELEAQLRILQIDD